MGNRIIYMILAGAGLLGWWWVGMNPYYAMDGGISTGYLVAAVLMLVLGSGSGDGDNPVEVVVGAITGSIPNIISVGAAFVISRLIYQLVLSADGFNAMGLVNALATVVASGILISITVACIRNSD